MCEALRRKGEAVAIRSSVRGLVLGAAALAVVAAPVSAAWVVQHPSQTLADCGGVNMPIFSEGTPVNTCPAPAAPVYTGGAPSQQTLTACSGIPGCLSSVLYGPGNVMVPSPNTRVQQSQ
ncbi:MAG: hypothetical protein JO191_01910 [Mycobacteriaceae bacterium]|nr:hypothetical protein [Mycobacteriaceae bacterium]